MKSTSIVLLQIGRAVTWEQLPYDDFMGESPYESTPIRNEVLFHSFRNRLISAAEDWPFVPLLCEREASIAHTPRGLQSTLGESLAYWRQQVEQDWGCDNYELAVSGMSHYTSFREFVTLILNDADRFRESYNRAIRDYRIAHKLKSRNHPAPELEANELPIWTMTDGTRQRTFHVDDVSTLRPKALILTLFARLILGDFFIHGLGGGKYDVVTDSIIRDYFGMEPPPYQILTATLHLPFEPNQIQPAMLDAARQTERDLYWNPQRHLPSASAHDRHREIVALPQSTRDERHNRYRRFRQLADELRRQVNAEMLKVRQSREWLTFMIEQHAILARRDYAWVLYPESVLKPFLTSFL